MGKIGQHYDEALRTMQQSEIKDNRSYCLRSSRQSYIKIEEIIERKDEYSGKQFHCLK
jgi:hypothetical protein